MTAEMTAGMTDRALGLVFLACWLAVHALRAVLVRGRRRGPVETSHVTGLDRSLKVLNLVGAQLVPVVYVLTPWLDPWDYALPAWAGVLGAGLAAACPWLVWRCHVDLGTSWTSRVELHAGHALVTHGIYGRVRHPIYATLLLWGVAQALLLQNWIAGPSGLVFALAFYLARVRREEAMMLDRFGDAYRAYMERTGRLWPRPRRSGPARPLTRRPQP
jgi:protein-S-isoprenylcysteine O-methyltransferase Ste14